jgi:hypothetical protein
VRFVIEGGAAERVRVRAQEQTEVQCPDGSWAAECLLSAVPAAELQSVPARRAAGAPADDRAVGSVGLFVEGGHAFVTVPFPRPSTRQPPCASRSPEPTPAPAPRTPGPGERRRSGESPAEQVGLPLRQPLRH